MLTILIHIIMRATLTTQVTLITWEMITIPVIRIILATLITRILASLTIAATFIILTTPITQLIHTTSMMATTIRGITMLILIITAGRRITTVARITMQATRTRPTIQCTSWAYRLWPTDMEAGLFTFMKRS